METPFKSISIEELSKRINGKLWIKGDMKRIYIDAGYNTKKMSTKAYIYQREDGSFGVSCYIECPSQPMAWIKSQQKEVIEGINRDIELHTMELVDYKILEERPGIMFYVKKAIDETPVWYDEDSFYNVFGIYPDQLFENCPSIIVQNDN